MKCNLCGNLGVLTVYCECQYTKVEPMLRAQLLAEVVRRGISLNPEDYSEDGEWECIGIGDEFFDVNMWSCDGFHITAYFTEHTGGGYLATNSSKYFRLIDKTFKQGETL